MGKRRSKNPQHPEHERVAHIYVTTQNIIVEHFYLKYMDFSCQVKSMHSTKKPVTTMLTYPWKCTVLHCNHLGNTWKPLVLMTRHFHYCPSARKGDNQSVRSSTPVVSRCFPGGYNVKLYISRGRLAWWLLAFLHSDAIHSSEMSEEIVFFLCIYNPSLSARLTVCNFFSNIIISAIKSFKERTQLGTKYDNAFAMVKEVRTQSFMPLPNMLHVMHSTKSNKSGLFECMFCMKMA